MRIKSSPENYTGTLTPVIYEIDQTEPSQIINIGILSGPGDSITVEKRLSGESSYTINTANYCIRQITIEPAATKWSGFGKDEQRCTDSRIKVGEEMSRVTLVTGGSKKCLQKVILSDAPARHTIAYGEKDEIAFIAEGSQISAKAILTGSENSREEVCLGDVACEEGIYVLVVDTAYIGSCLNDPFDKYHKMDVEITDETDKLGIRSYRLITGSANTLRLCWQNPYGQIDYHTFRLTGETIGIDKSRAYVEEGYATTCITRDVTRHAVSECLPKTTIKWLSEILAAPKVWVAEHGGYTRVDVLTEKLLTRCDYPESISISLRNAKRLTIKQA